MIFSVSPTIDLEGRPAPSTRPPAPQIIKTQNILSQLPPGTGKMVPGAPDDASFLCSERL